MLHRTLLLAQRASDEAIAEAEEKARVMIEEAETRSRRMLADAAIEARRTTETERRRLEQEIAELQNRREVLSTDVDGLEHFETDYRSRLMSAMEADLHAIERDLKVIRDRSDAAPADRPELADVDAPVPSASGSGSAPSDSGATMEVDVRGFRERCSFVGEHQPLLVGLLALAPFPGRATGRDEGHNDRRKVENVRQRIDPKFDHVRPSLHGCGNVPFRLRLIVDEDGDAEVGHGRNAECRMQNDE
jgi:vacuolar-type H+-ATPase subunit H